MKTTPTYPQRLLYDVSRPLDWRWQRASSLAQQQCPLLAERDDEQTLTAAHYLGRTKRRPGSEYYGLVQAIQLTEGGTSLIGEVQARILAGQDDHVIADRGSLAPEDVYWYEALFFNVRDRLKAHDWIALRAIRLNLLEAVPVETACKHFAYIGGPIVLEIVLAVTQNKPFPAEVRAILQGDPHAAEARLRLSARGAITALTAPAGVPPQLLNRLLSNKHRERKPGEAARLKLMAQTLRMANPSGRRGKRSARRKEASQGAEQAVSNIDSLMRSLLGR